MFNINKNDGESQTCKGENRNGESEELLTKVDSTFLQEAHNVKEVIQFPGLSMANVLQFKNKSSSVLKPCVPLSGQTLFSKFMEENNPRTLLIACCDPFSMPLTMDDPTGKRSLVLQTLGALIPPFHLAAGNQETFATIEYALDFFHIEHIVVVGHHDCSVLSSFSENSTAGSLEPCEWLSDEIQSMPTFFKDKGTYPDLGRQVVVRSCENLLTKPAVASRVGSKKLKIHAWFFEAHNNHIDFMDFS